jgi:hypothetical protein
MVLSLLIGTEGIHILVEYLPGVGVERGGGGGGQLLLPKMRPKAREMTQHGGLPCWLKESDPCRRVRFVLGWTVHAAFPGLAA